MIRNVASGLKIEANVKTPFTKKDYEEIDAMCEVLITHLNVTRDNSSSHWVKLTASDIIDVMVDLKIDMAEFGKKNAMETEADGFVTITGTTPERKPK
jgi:tRNA A37 threonylcarbamoyladenosine dehydratase